MLHARILVPLDGSELSDQTLVQIRRLLQSPGAQVRLLTVVDPTPFRHTLRPMRGARDDEVVNQRLDRAKTHLEQAQERLRTEGVEASVSVIRGVPGEVILDEATAFDATLVAMTTHGRNGLSQWVFGSAAQRVLRRCPAPLLLLRPQADGPQELSFRRLLVALDGSERAEKILPLARELAALYSAEILLLSAGGREPDDSDDIVFVGEPDEDQAELASLLQPCLEELRASGLQARSLVEWGPPAEAISAALSQEGADLLALTTHGRTGLRRFFLGSVAEKALRASPVPVLLLRTPEE